MQQSNATTIGQLSRRAGVPIKILREYERLGFLYTCGRSESNYRLFGEETLWCVRMAQGLRSLGLPLKEIQTLTTSHLGCPANATNALREEQLLRVLARVESRIATLQALRQRILDFQAACASAQTPSLELAHLFAPAPRRGTIQSAS